MTTKTLRLRVAELRERKGLTQQALADLADVRQATISDIETGKAKRVTVDVALRLAAALGVKAAVLMGLEPMPKSRGNR